MLPRRLGQFQLDIEGFENDEAHSWHEVFGQLKFIPLEVRYRYDLETYEFLGYSPMFREAERGLIAPKYDIIVHIEPSGDLTVKAEEIQPVKSSFSLDGEIGKIVLSNS